MFHYKSHNFESNIHICLRKIFIYNFEYFSKTIVRPLLTYSTETTGTYIVIKAEEKDTLRTIKCVNQSNNQIRSPAKREDLITHDLERFIDTLDRD